jgi:hypothetical protein
MEQIKESTNCMKGAKKVNILANTAGESFQVYQNWLQIGVQGIPMGQIKENMLLHCRTYV